MAKKKPKTTLRGRDARNGQFITVAQARKRKSTAVVERVPIGKPKRKKT